MNAAYRWLFSAGAAVLMVAGLAEPATAAPPPTPVWVAQADSPSGGYDSAEAVAVDERTGITYVTGSGSKTNRTLDAVTIAYDATGQVRWQRNYNGYLRGADVPAEIVADSGNGQVVVTIRSEGADGSDDIATVAYDSRTGRTRWVDRYTGGAGAQVRPAGLALEPGTGSVYVVGTETPAGAGLFESDLVTIGYDVDGTRLWQDTYAGPDGRAEVAAAVAVSLNADQVLVAATSSLDSAGGYVLRALDPSRGSVQWTQRIDDLPAGQSEIGGLAATSAGDVLLLGRTEADDLAVGVVHRLYSYSRPGFEQWTAEVRTSNGSANSALGVDVNSGGSYVALAYRPGLGPVPTAARFVLAYADDGSLRWVDRFAAAPTNSPSAPEVSVAVDGIRGRVYVGTPDYATGGSDVLPSAYTTGGALRWRATYDRTPFTYETPADLAVDPGTGRVLVLATAPDSGSNGSITTLAYPPA